jgi:hypothetical protein
MPVVSDVQHYVRNQVWDTDTLSWVVMTAAAAAGGGLTQAELESMLPLPVLASIDTTGLATEAKQTTGNASLASIDGKLTNPLPVSGSVDVTGSSVAASILTIGQQTMANSVPVTLASNQGALTVATHAVTGTFFQATQPVSGSLGHLSSSAAALSNVSASASSVQLLASTAGRRMVTIHNDSTATLFVKFGTTASATSYTVEMVAGAYFEFPHPVFTGRVDGIWESANGSARITEMT